jgi:hypothetical protein
MSAFIFTSVKQAASRHFIAKQPGENVTYFHTVMKVCLVLQVSVTSPSEGLLKKKKRKCYFNLLTTLRRCGWRDGL